MHAIQSIFQELDFSELRIVFCKRFTQESATWNLTRHSHPYLELLFFLRGEAEVSVGDHVLSLSSFDLAVYLPQHEHQESIDLGREQEVICVWVDVGELPPLEESSFRLRDHGRTLEWLFVHLEQAYAAGALYGNRLSACYLEAIFHTMLRSLTDADSRRVNDSIEKACAYISMHYAEPLSVPSLAAYIHVSPSYFHRIFRKRTGMSPVQYITDVRLREAEYLLGADTLSIAEVASQCGFEDASYFSRIFTRAKGVSPLVYRKRSLSKPV